MSPFVMHVARRVPPAIAALVVAVVFAGLVPAAEPLSSDAAWKSLPAFRDGQDLAVPLAIERDVLAALGDSGRRAAVAARLAAILADPAAAADARRFACFQLRQCGGAAEVPAVARALAATEPAVADAARQALEAIPDDAAAAALRAALPQAAGDFRIGLVNALGVRRDASAVEPLIELAGSSDARAAEAAVRALGLIGGPKATAWLTGRRDDPVGLVLGEALLRVAESAARSGDAAVAAAVRDRLAAPGQPRGLRLAALRGQLAAEAARGAATVRRWLADADPVRRELAVAALGGLDEATLREIVAAIDEYRPDTRPAILAVATARVPKAALPVVVRCGREGPGPVRTTALECLGRLRAPEGIPVLLAALEIPDAGDPGRIAARDAIAAVPRDVVAAALVRGLDTNPAARPAIIGLLGDVAAREAWEPLARIVVDDAGAWQAAVDGLRRLAAPEDLGRLVDLFARLDDDDRRDAVARVIVAVAEKGRDPAATLLAALDERRVPAVAALPLAGRLGGPQAIERIEAGLASSDATTRAAAIRGLCSWPNAEVADRLLGLARRPASTDADRDAARRALKAYVRVVTLPTDRAAEKTLAMVQEAMRLAADGAAEDRGFILERAAARVRTMPAVEWVAAHLDDPAVAQAACRGLLDLAHHKGLRQPNRARFDELLDRVAAVATDPAVAERARKYRLGL